MKKKKKKLTEKSVQVKNAALRCSDLSFSHQVSCYSHVLEEDGQVQSAVTFSISNGGIGSISHQLDHHGQVALPVQENIMMRRLREIYRRARKQLKLI